MINENQGDMGPFAVAFFFFTTDLSKPGSQCELGILQIFMELDKNMASHKSPFWTVELGGI